MQDSQGDIGSLWHGQLHSFYGGNVAFAALPIQEARLSMQHRSVSLNQVFSEIERQTGYSFLVRNNDINTNQKISIDVKNKSVKEVLEILFAGKNIRYEVEGERISVYKPQQTRQTTISGIVVDAAQGTDYRGFCRSGKHNQRLYHGF